MPGLQVSFNYRDNSLFFFTFNLFLPLVYLSLSIFFFSSIPPIPVKLSCFACDFPISQMYDKIPCLLFLSKSDPPSMLQTRWKPGQYCYLLWSCLICRIWCWLMMEGGLGLLVVVVVTDSTEVSLVFRTELMALEEVWLWQSLCWVLCLACH